jgi:hypothetical protein
VNSQLATLHNVNISPTIPLGRDLLADECAKRGINKDTFKPLDPKSHFMVLMSALTTKPGIIHTKPEDFIKNYWVGKELVNPTIEITFVGWNFTINGKITNLVSWAKSLNA